MLYFGPWFGIRLVVPRKHLHVRYQEIRKSPGVWVADPKTLSDRCTACALDVHIFDDFFEGMCFFTEMMVLF